MIGFVSWDAAFEKLSLPAGGVGLAIGIVNVRRIIFTILFSKLREEEQDEK